MTSREDTAPLAVLYQLVILVALGASWVPIWELAGLSPWISVSNYLIFTACGHAGFGYPRAALL